jgi:hypothetical protein
MLVVEGPFLVVVLVLCSDVILAPFVEPLSVATPVESLFVLVVGTDGLFGELVDWPKVVPPGLAVERGARESPFVVKTPFVSVETSLFLRLPGCALSVVRILDEALLVVVVLRVEVTSNLVPESVFISVVSVDGGGV